ncbi:MAG: CTP synthase (glutamine hydrolyzing) [Candidatus Diapherotrites archaeon]|nr:CTP synthase (glutamine hydrolyzing) [Candidatus Diapherotrites archaeon]MDZ4256786.1 CTP synthase (glutamine hydrolyzing) [archaeon]
MAPDAPSHSTKKTKYIVVTGGVLSGLGKGIAAASIGHLFASAGLKVIPMKLDGYLNVDPGTMNPIEHGEVFVLDDGGEVDMDFGHYERFLGVTCKSEWNLTMGKIYDFVRQKERRGDYLGKTVQYIPHVTNAIKELLHQVVEEEHPDILLIEVGGTVGDMENELYVEAVRQLRKEVGETNIAYVHLTYVPILSAVKEQKSKPTQQSVGLLRQRGIQPDIIIGRCKEKLTDAVKARIAMFCDIRKEGVITGLDVDDVYKIPIVYYEEGILTQLNSKLGLDAKPCIQDWEPFLRRHSEKKARIAICGKYTSLGDSYASVIEAIHHAAAHQEVDPIIQWVETTAIEEGKVTVSEALKGIDGIVVPGGFGGRGTEGKIQVIQYAREHHIPFLGLCYGMQLAVIEFARHACHLHNAHSSEINPGTPHPVIDLLPEQVEIKEKGATMRLGGQDVAIQIGTRAHALFGDTTRLRFRHRYEVNPKYIPLLTQYGMIFSGRAPEREIMQVLELPNHPFFMATQAHPELTSRPDKPNPLFHAFVGACVPIEKVLTERQTHNLGPHFP